MINSVYNHCEKMIQWSIVWYWSNRFIKENEIIKNIFIRHVWTINKFMGNCDTTKVDNTQVDTNNDTIV